MTGKPDRWMPPIHFLCIDAQKGEMRLYDPFLTTREKRHGLGTLYRGAVAQKHSGELHYLTQANRGTSFGVIMPRAKE